MSLVALEVLHLKDRDLLWRNSQGGVQELASRQVHVQLWLREVHWSISLLGAAHHFRQSEPGHASRENINTQLFLKEQRCSLG